MVLLAGSPAEAIPLWAHEYGVTCQKCHTVIPHLSSFGMHFAANGYRIPGVQPGPAARISTKLNLADSSVNQGSGPSGSGLPKAILDEVELLTAGLAGERGNYYVEQYAIDGGEHGLLREAWFNYRVNPWFARVPLYVQTGSFTLPLPVDPETQRETYQHYTLFDHTVGNNPFTFFDPKIGAKISVGDTLRGMSAQVFAGPGHDRQSGLQTIAADFMGSVQHAMGPLTMSVYRYEGTRPDGAVLLDRFERTGYGVVAVCGKWESDSVLQTGFDSSVNGAGAASSGGFEQLRYAFGPRLFALSRYEGTSDAGGVARDAVLLVGYRPDHNARLTLEDVISHAPQTENTMNLQLTAAY